jgi:hypothetical protein
VGKLRLNTRGKYSSPGKDGRVISSSVVWGEIWKKWREKDGMQKENNEEGKGKWKVKG